MESSSESNISNNSFLWADTSNDSSIDTSAVKRKQTNSCASTKMDDIKPSKDKYKSKYITCTSPGIENNCSKLEVSDKKENTNNGHNQLTIRTKGVKTDVDLTIKKLKHSRCLLSDDDSYLNLKVKQEEILSNDNSTGKNNVSKEMSNCKPKKKKKKAKKRHESGDINNDSGMTDHLHGLEEIDTFLEQVDYKEYDKQKKSRQSDYQSSLNNTDIDLNNKVKLEEILVTTPVEQKHKSKKRKHSEISVCNGSEAKSSKGEHSRTLNVDLVEGVVCSEFQDSELKYSNKTKRNKRKSVTHNEETNYSNILVEDKFEAEETVVRVPTKQIQPAAPIILHVNETFQDNCGEDNLDEISAIKGDDDDHNLQTTFFSNKGIENELSDRNDSTDGEKSTEESFHDPEEVKTKGTFSDRLLFEEDDVNMKSTHVNNSSSHINNSTQNNSVKLNNYLKRNPTMGCVSQSLNNGAIITKDDNLWILKCPRDIDIEDLSSMDLKIDGMSKIKINGQSYEGSIIEEHNARVTVLSMEHTKYELKNLPSCGIITLRRRIPKLHINEVNIMTNNQTNFIPLPETKCRHPLLGIHYKKALKIAERLSTAQLEQPIIHKKKKKSAPIGVGQIELSSAEPARKKRKTTKPLDHEASAPKKKKCREHNPEIAGAWESEKAIEENLFNF